MNEVVSDYTLSLYLLNGSERNGDTLPKNYKVFMAEKQYETSAVTQTPFNNQESKNK